jgi:hypothetical protein
MNKNKFHPYINKIDNMINDKIEKIKELNEELNSIQALDVRLYEYIEENVKELEKLKNNREKIYKKYRDYRIF